MSDLIGGRRGQPRVTPEMVEAAFDALAGKCIDGRRPMHSEEAVLLCEVIAAAINSAPENL